MTDKLFTVYLDMPLASKESVYDFLTDCMTQELSLANQIRQCLLDRECAGNIKIADYTLLPHLKMSNLSSRIIILRTSQIIECWSEHITQVRLIIAIFLSHHATTDERKKIQRFVKRLAQDDFINQLLIFSKEEITPILEV